MKMVNFYLFVALISCVICCASCQSPSHSLISAPLAEERSVKNETRKPLSLRKVADPKELRAIDIRWDSKDQFAIQTDFRLSEKAKCLTETWQIYTIEDFTNDIIQQQPILEPSTDCLAHSETTDLLGQFNAELIQKQITSRDGSTRLFIVSSHEKNAPLTIGSNDTSEVETYYQGWLIYQNQAPLLLFSTAKDWVYDFSDDNRYIIVDSLCYGNNLGIGLYVIDTSDLTIYPVQEQHHNNCEGSQPLLISPDSQHLLFADNHGTILNLEDKHERRLCLSDEFAQTFTWSSQGRFVYMACSSSHEVFLVRYDVTLDQAERLFGPEQIRIQPMKMRISPDQRFLLFEWGFSTFHPVEDYGVWLLQLE